MLNNSNRLQSHILCREVKQKESGHLEVLGSVLLLAISDLVICSVIRKTAQSFESENPEIFT